MDLRGYEQAKFELVSKLFRPSSITSSYYCYYFKTVDSFFPGRFAVAVNAKAQIFNNINVFFHPSPKRADMEDAQYPDGGNWPNLFRYAPYLGRQLAASGKDQILIMPYLREADFGSTGDLAFMWQTFFSDIAALVQADVTGRESEVEIYSLVVSSFSTGIKSSDGFRSKGKNVSNFLSEIWDFDGMSSDFATYSQHLRGVAGVKIIQYQQSVPSKGTMFNIAWPRWVGTDPGLAALAKAKPKAALKAVHANVMTNLFYHACTISGVGKSP